jgi:hypothetical protein
MQLGAGGILENPQKRLALQKGRKRLRAWDPCIKT